MTQEAFLQTPTSQYIESSSRDYSIYVCETRAIPRVSDGLKDGVRKAHWLLRNRASEIKTISLAGELISSGLYLHGDAAAADAISSAAAPFLNNVPLIEGIGNFGTRVAPGEYGAPRYTYVKPNRAAKEILYADSALIPTKENYDGSTVEPETFLPLIPTVLLNGISGIAVGWSTEILPRSLPDLIDAALAVIDGKKIKRLMPAYTAFNCKVQHIEGNQYEIQGKLEIISANKVRVIELPPGLSIERFRKRLDELEEKGIIKDWTDNSSESIAIEVDFKRTDLLKLDEDDLLETFKLKEKTTERIVVIDWGGKAIRQYKSAEEVVVDFVKWRFDYYIKRYQKYKADDEMELRYWQALKKCFQAQLPKKLQTFKNRDELKDFVITTTKTIKPTDEQVNKIVSLSSYKWTVEGEQEVDKNISQLTSNISDYDKHLNDHSLIWAVFRSEVAALKKIKI
jgi:DNA gyrase/topoisomerase IV subunit A